MEPDDIPEGVAASNRRYAASPAVVMARAGRWVSRLVGQARRQVLSRLRPAYVRRRLADRRGQCRRCGACCDLTFHCPFLDDARRCRIYEKRMRTCRDFPMDATDLALTRVPCGHYFEPGPEKDRVRIPLARYGLRELVLFGGLAVAGLVLSAVFFWYLVPLFALALGFVLFFFRDPERRVPSAAEALVSPADGKVVQMDDVEEPEFLGERAHRIAIFMSPLDVHVNRAPCDGEVESVAHRAGGFTGAYKAAASAENERTSLLLRQAAGGRTRVLVRQIAGLVARRIVCDAAVGDRLARGQRFGMVKFGSRAEVYVPVASSFQCAVRVGQRVRAGETILGSFR